MKRNEDICSLALAAYMVFFYGIFVSLVMF
jgi:hypothetical protein